MTRPKASLETLFSKNLNFFETQNPQIYNVIKHIELKHSTVTVNEKGDIELTYKGKNIYGGDAISYVQKEVESFKQLFKDDYRPNLFGVIKPGDYGAPRFFHRHLDKTVSLMFKSAKDKNTTKIYHDKKFDCLVVMGIGLGLHLTELLDKLEIQNLIILETDYELLKLSCYFTDWESVYNVQNTKHKKSITLILTNDLSVHPENTGLWNELIKRAPHFPFNSIFYNHGRHDNYGKIIRKINSDVKMFMSLWGFYDDESNQLNHALHNLNNNIKLIPDVHEFSWNKPVIICGSGPSLDERINQLKSIRENCILISAGTSLSTLLKNNMKPDFHVEIESDYAVYTAIRNISEEHSLKDITLICALQCSPYITTLFSNSIAYVKDSMAIGSTIEKDHNILHHATPTCVNAALALAFKYKSNSILLFGTDFGFYDESSHHSKHSIYNNNEKNDEDTVKIKRANEKFIKNNFEQEGYEGTCLTTNIYFTTKRRVEVAINGNRLNYKFNVFNCSDGLIIDGTTHLNKKSEISLPYNSVHESDLNHFSRSINKDAISKIKEVFLPSIKSLCDLLILNIKTMENTKYDFSAKCWAISNYINTTFKDKYGSTQFLIRGTIWHYMTSGYSIIYTTNPEEQEKLISIWKERFIDFLIKLPIELDKQINKDRKDIYSDPQLLKKILEPID